MNLCCHHTHCPVLQERKYPCSEHCGFSAVSEEELTRHFARKHKDMVLLPGSQVSQRRYMCPHCPFLDSERKVVQQHMKFHGKKAGSGAELKMFCTHCSFVTDCASKLRRHQFVHNQEKPFGCKKCHYKANQKEHVVRHLRTKHHIIIKSSNKPVKKAQKNKPVAVAVSSDNPKQNVEAPAENPLVKSSDIAGQIHTAAGWDKLFACNFCTLTFSKLLNLYKHLHAQHEDKMWGHSRLSCVICDFTGSTYATLLGHMRRHTASEEAKMAATDWTATGLQQTSIMSVSKAAKNPKRVKSTTSSNDPSKKTVLLNLNQSLDNGPDILPVIIDVPNYKDDANNVEDDGIDDGLMTVANEHEVIMQKQEGESTATTDEIMWDLTTVDEDDAADLHASIQAAADGNIQALGEKEGITVMDDGVMVTDEQVMVTEEMKDLEAGDFIQINGETYQVKIEEITSKS